MSRPTVYLAGPIDGLTYDEATAWRLTFTQRLDASGISGVDPMRGKEFLSGMRLDHGTEGRDPFHHPMALDKGIMGRDHHDCMRCDLIIANFLDCKKVSIGTCIECAWRYAARKPVVAVLEPGNCHDHPMMRETWTYAVSSLDAAFDICVAMLAPYARRCQK